MKSLASIKYIMLNCSFSAKSVSHKWKDNDEKYISHSFRSLE